MRLLQVSGRETLQQVEGTHWTDWAMSADIETTGASLRCFFIVPKKSSIPSLVSRFEDLGGN